MRNPGVRPEFSYPWMLLACFLPLLPLVISKETFWPSFRFFESRHVDRGEMHGRRSTFYVDCPKINARTCSRRGSAAGLNLTSRIPAALRR